MPAALLTDHAPSELRERAMRAAKWFTASERWLPLAQPLVAIRAAKAWRAWGFHSFTDYVEEELDLTKSTVSELVKAHGYLAHRRAEYVAKDRSAAEHLPVVPSYANLAILARAATRLPEEVVEALDQGLFAGAIKRHALKEAIKKELARREAHEETAAEDLAQGDAEPHARPQHPQLREAVEASLEALDLAALREQIALVFDGWAEISGDERRQLLMRLHLLD